MTCKSCEGTGKTVAITTVTIPFIGERELYRKEDPCAPCRGTGKLEG